MTDKISKCSQEQAVPGKDSDLQKTRTIRELAEGRLGGRGCQKLFPLNFPTIPGLEPRTCSALGKCSPTGLYPLAPFSNF